jgi:hypothetical protein
MHIALYENNLLWSVRLQRAAIQLGHTCTIMQEPDLPAVMPHLAIINLSVEKFVDAELIAELKSAGSTVVGHAGHSEKLLHHQGRDAHIDHLVTNGALANDLPSVLALVPTEE